mmetsp:Transcript_21992/g.61200  ORF Transcript_21992/g.61200 Transcript_21992/m.61200 type:complete len:81 (-) Transcript_21992:1060-1302(-)
MRKSIWLSYSIRGGEAKKTRLSQFSFPLRLRSPQSNGQLVPVQHPTQHVQLTSAQSTEISVLRDVANEQICGPIVPVKAF